MIVDEDTDTELDDQGLDLAWELATDIDAEAPERGLSMLVQQRATGDGADGLTTFVASTDDEDRALDVVRQDWRLASFRRNPVILDNHKSMRVVGRGQTAKVPKVGADAGKLIIDVRWDLDNPDPGLRAVGHQHQNGFRSAGSVGFRFGKRTERSKLKEDHPKYAPPTKVETPWGSFERSGSYYEQNELLEFSSATIPMNPAALQRALDRGEPAAQVIDRLAEIDPADLERRLAVVEQTLPASVASDLAAALPALLADAESRATVLGLLVPDLKLLMRSDAEFRRIVEGYALAAPARPARRTVPGGIDALDYLFPTID